MANNETKKSFKVEIGLKPVDYTAHVEKIDNKLKEIEKLVQSRQKKE